MVVRDGCEGNLARRRQGSTALLPPPLPPLLRSNEGLRCSTLMTMMMMLRGMLLMTVRGTLSQG